MTSLIINNFFFNFLERVIDSFLFLVLKKKKNGGTRCLAKF